MGEENKSIDRASKQVGHGRRNSERAAGHSAPPILINMYMYMVMYICICTCMRVCKRTSICMDMYVDTVHPQSFQHAPRACVYAYVHAHVYVYVDVY